MRISRVAPFVLAAAALGGCAGRAGEVTAQRVTGSRGASPDGTPTGTAAPGAPGTFAGIGDAGSSSAPAPVPPDQCTDASRLVYVVSRENDLYSLRPDA